MQLEVAPYVYYTHLRVFHRTWYTRLLVGFDTLCGVARLKVTDSQN